MPRSTVSFALSILFFFIAAQALMATGPGNKTGPGTAAGQAKPPAEIVIDLDKAQTLKIPKPDKDLVPTTFKQGISGWVLRIPGQKALATPAFYKGKLYVGGGYGSYEFYCFDALTGNKIWQYRTNDDGPTAAVVEDDCVAFNTESCTVFVLAADTGKCLWQEWLGDPLMSQPAISKGKLYIAYPSGQRGHNKPGHVMLCADLKTGKHLWEESISADVISAPVVDGDKLYFTCMDGTSFCLNSQDGHQQWKKRDGATSAPVVAKGQFIVARKAMHNGVTGEGLQGSIAQSGNYLAQAPTAVGNAPYLQGATNGTIGPQGANKANWYKSQDSQVGFGGGAPTAAHMSVAASNMGLSSVAGAWGYQGAKASFKNGAFYNSQGTQVNALCEDGKSVKWRGAARGNFINGQSQVFNPPSLGRQNMYLCSGDGHVVSLKQSTGEIEFMYATPFPISFQPALAGGKIFIPTGDGHLVCLDTANPDADGWTAWGGNAQHNKQD